MEVCLCQTEKWKCQKDTVVTRNFLLLENHSILHVGSKWWRFQVLGRGIHMKLYGTHLLLQYLVHLHGLRHKYPFLALLKTRKEAPFVTIINPQRMCKAAVVILCVCLLHTLFASQNCSVISFLMAFQTHVLCGFRWKHFVHLFRRHLLKVSFMTFSQAALNVLIIWKIMYTHTVCYKLVRNSENLGHWVKRVCSPLRWRSILLYRRLYSTI